MTSSIRATVLSYRTNPELITARRMNPVSKLSRRRFLNQTATAVGGALAIPNLIPASALGRNGLLPPSQRITMGFIGGSTQGGRQLRGAASTYMTRGCAGARHVH